LPPALSRNTPFYFKNKFNVKRKSAANQELTDYGEKCKFALFYSSKDPMRGTDEKCMRGEVRRS
jgi:hypothetical protein